jgi:diguanylate cyclase (GGDEF)-like protein
MVVLRSGSWRRHASLVLILALVLGAGAFGVFAARQATERASDVHRADREAFRSIVSKLVAGYVLTTFSSLQEQAARDGFSLRAGDPVDRAALQRMVDGSPFFGEGAVLTDLTGRTLTAYTPGGPVPPIDHPGYRPLVASLTQGRPGTSSLLTAGDRKLAAFALPVVRQGVPRALLVGFMRFDGSGPSKQFLAGLPLGPRTTLYVLDGEGQVVASNRETAVGTVTPAQRAFTAARAGGSGLLTDERDGVAFFDAYEPVPDTGWTLVVEEPATDFLGPIESGGAAVQIAVLVLLVAAAGTVVVLHHRRQMALHQLADQALHDPLTGLPNRILFQSRLDAALGAGVAPHTGVALLFCDLDGFKAVNDAYGHAAGDHLLVAVGERLRSCVREGDLVARMGGDEFTVLLDGAGDPGPELTRRATEVARRIGDALGEPVELGLGRPPVRVGVSIGVSVLEARDSGERPPSPDAAPELLKLADAAMYEAKAKRSGWELAGADR